MATSEYINIHVGRTTFRYGRPRRRIGGTVSYTKITLYLFTVYAILTITGSTRVMLYVLTSNIRVYNIYFSPSGTSASARFRRNTSGGPSVFVRPNRSRANPIPQKFWVETNFGMRRNLRYRILATSSNSRVVGFEEF